MNQETNLKKKTFVGEAVIDAAAARVGADEKGYLQALEQLQEEQPAALAYLYSDSFSSFSQEEREYLLFLVLVLYSSIRAGGREVVPASEEAIETAEEANWTLLEETNAKRFRDRLDVFFEGYFQEDLLAFAEDSLIDPDADDVPLVNKESREPLFVALKSLIDCLA